MKNKIFILLLLNTIFTTVRSAEVSVDSISSVIKRFVFLDQLCRDFLCQSLALDIHKVSENKADLEELADLEKLSAFFQCSEKDQRVVILLAKMTEDARLGKNTTTSFTEARKTNPELDQYIIERSENTTA